MVEGVLIFVRWLLVTILVLLIATIVKWRSRESFHLLSGPIVLGSVLSIQACDQTGRNLSSTRGLLICVANLSSGHIGRTTLGLVALRVIPLYWLTVAASAVRVLVVSRISNAIYV